MQVRGGDVQVRGELVPVLRRGDLLEHGGCEGVHPLRRGERLDHAGGEHEQEPVRVQAGLRVDTWELPAVREQRPGEG